MNAVRSWLVYLSNNVGVMKKDQTILVISPNQAEAAETTSLLEKKGYQVLAASSWREARAQITIDLPELVMVSVDEAPLWALDLLWELKENLPNAEFIIVTRDPAQPVVIDALNVGVRGVLLYPFDTTKLLSLVQSCLSEYRKLESLRRSEEYYKTVVTTAPDVIIHLDQDGKIKDINRIPWYLSGRKVLGSSPISFIDEEYHEVYLETVDRVIANNSIESCEYALHAANGELVWCEANLGPIRKFGSIEGVSLIMRDVTRRVEYIAEIEQQRNELNMLFELGKKVNATLNIHEVYDHLHDQVSAMMDCSQFSVSSVNPETKMICCEYFVNDNVPVDVSSFPPIPLNPEGKGTQSRVIVSGKPMVLNDYQTHMRTSKKKFMVRNDGSLHEEEEIPDDADVPRSAIIAPMIFKGDVVGVIQVISYRLNAYSENDLHLLETACTQMAVASNNAMLYRQAQDEIQERIQTQRELQESYDSTLRGWVAALERREKETAGHSKRVTELTMRFATCINVAQEERIHFWRGALLHDIGKLVIPDSILLKQDSLTETEWAIMKQHGEYAYEWLSSIDYLKPVLAIPRYHHERWDGSGYPRGLKGEEIPLPARMFAIIDVYDALMNDRPYRKAWRTNKVIDYFREQTGKLFDPMLVDVFIEMITEDHKSKRLIPMPAELKIKRLW